MKPLQGSRIRILKNSIMESIRGFFVFSLLFHDIKVGCSSSFIDSKCILSRQIIATSHDLTPKWWFSKGNPHISGKSRLVKYNNLARYFALKGIEHPIV